MRLVFLDLETGGLDPTKHPIIQIAALAVDAALVELESFEVKVLFDLRQADEEALSLNSWNADTWAKQAVAPGAAIGRLSEFLKDYSDVRMVSARTGKPYYVAQLVGHNAATFDGPFLQTFYKNQGAFLPASYRVLCTLQRAIWLFHERPDLSAPADFKLGTLCKHFGIEIAEAHDAMADVRATVALYRALVSQVEISE